MRPVIDDILAELLRRHRAAGSVHLNDIAEVIGLRAVTYEEVEHIVILLEEEGLRVGEPLDVADVSVMREVLAGARKLGAALGRRPTVDEIARETGHPDHAVRRALENGRGLVR